MKNTQGLCIKRQSWIRKVQYRSKGRLWNSAIILQCFWPVNWIVTCLDYQNNGSIEGLVLLCCWHVWDGQEVGTGCWQKHHCEGQAQVHGQFLRLATWWESIVILNPLLASKLDLQWTSDTKDISRIKTRHNVVRLYVSMVDKQANTVCLKEAVSLLTGQKVMWWMAF